MKPDKTPFNFEEWLVGLTDGDGTFNIYTNNLNKKINFTYKISLHKKDIQLIYLIKKSLRCGHVYLDKNSNMVSYVIKNKLHLEKIIFLYLIIINYYLVKDLII